jgi:hypothetical protein
MKYHQIDRNVFIKTDQIHGANEINSVAVF